MALLSTEAFDTVEKIARQMTYLDLMGNNRFMEEFVSASFLVLLNLKTDSFSGELHGVSHVDYRTRRF
jgi:uncharacterized 2Fe-2S/4Fe-4S cluster protein (DUF4445 family)